MSDKKEVQKALDVVKALELLEKELDVKVTDLIARVCFYDDKNVSKMKRIVGVYNNFIESDLVSRGEMLGIKITEGIG